MRKRKKTCAWCGKIFVGHPRLGTRQKSCGDPACKKKQKNSSHRLWKNKEKKTYTANQRNWRQNHPAYWKAYRADHPAYTRINRNQARIRKQFSVEKTGLQKRIDILQLSGKQPKNWNIPRFAKSPRSIIPLLFVYASRLHRKENPWENSG